MDSIKLQPYRNTLTSILDLVREASSQSKKLMKVIQEWAEATRRLKVSDSYWCRYAMNSFNSGKPKRTDNIDNDWENLNYGDEKLEETLFQSVM